MLFVGHVAIARPDRQWAINTRYGDPLSARSILVIGIPMWVRLRHRPRSTSIAPHRERVKPLGGYASSKRRRLAFPNSYVDIDRAKLVIDCLQSCLKFSLLLEKCRAGARKPVAINHRRGDLRLGVVPYIAGLWATHWKRGAQNSRLSCRWLSRR